ncbi:type I glyceraldehyde-3-phosphate dehydrogenase [Streptomyces sp. NPDC050095]|uniref:type I glyceraldehyde-3-phosphate dehydrogenase n=1 Tax=unclassified Streptomyces TaxID=2593676 RepID=UPI00342C1EB2
MTVRVGINGFGRIGRTYLRAALERVEESDLDLEVVAINDITSPATLAHLLSYDSTFGPLRRDVGHTDTTLIVDSREMAVSAEHDPAALRWGELGVDVVIESTGRFRTRDAAALHLKAGAGTVVLSAPGKDVDATIVMGVNDDTYDRDHHRIISAASCTTNCVAPMVKVLHENFGIDRGVMTTIHGYTNDQALLDGPHKDLRRARSAALSIIPTSTGAARAVGLVVPQLDGVLDGIAVRVPVEDGSLTDLAVVLGGDVTAEEINTAFATAARGALKGIIDIAPAPIVSRDVIGNPASCVFDPGLTLAHGTLAKVFGWYDNEWGYTQRLLDLTALVTDS